MATITSIQGMSIEAYEQYGVHPCPPVLATCDWARREEALMFVEDNELARRYSNAGASLRASRNNGG